MKKVLLAVCVGAVAMLWSGCSTTDPAPEAPVQAAPTVVTVTIMDIGTAVIDGVPGIVKTSIESDSVVTDVAYKITNSGGTEISNITIQKQQVTYGTHNVLYDTIVPQSGAAPGTYTLQIKAKAGTGVDSMQKSFTVETGVLGATLTLGAQSAQPPSLLDADNMTVYSNTTTDPLQQAEADAIFVYSTVLIPPTLTFTSPSVAQGTPYSNWTTRAASRFEDVSTSADYDTITTLEQIKRLWVPGSDTTRLTLSAGQVIVIYTSDQNYKLVRVVDINGADATATMDIKGKY